jgi:hypothetical protein
MNKYAVAGTLIKGLSTNELNIMTTQAVFDAESESEAIGVFIQEIQNKKRYEGYMIHKTICTPIIQLPLADINKETAE